jgi:hypothetical protein
MSAFFEDDVPNEVLYGDCVAQQPSTEEWCMNPLDKPYGLPGYLEKQVLELTSKNLLSTYFRLKTDITDNGVDGQAPNTSNNS